MHEKHAVPPKHAGNANLARLIARGLIGADGERHKLAARRVGGRWLVTEADTDAFFAELSRKAEAARAAAICSQRRLAESAAREKQKAGA